MKRISSSVLNICFLVSGVLLTIMLWQLSLKSLAYLLGVFATAMFIWLFALLALRFRTSALSPPKVLAALFSTLQHDPDPQVRSKAAIGLIELDLEKSFNHYAHYKLDDILISTLQHDPHPYVRSKVATGLAEVKLVQDQPSLYMNNKLHDILFKNGYTGPSSLDREAMPIAVDRWNGLPQAQTGLVVSDRLTHTHELRNEVVAGSKAA